MEAEAAAATDEHDVRGDSTLDHDERASAPVEPKPRESVAAAAAARMMLRMS
jgi:hypothetical protein